MPLPKKKAKFPNFCEKISKKNYVLRRVQYFIFNSRLNGFLEIALQSFFFVFLSNSRGCFLETIEPRIKNKVSFDYIGILTEFFLQIYENRRNNFVTIY